jgi:long-chain acyl-CoA synthetase
MNVASVLWRADGAATALIADGRRWTYDEVRADAGRVRAVLGAAGVGPGDVVALLAGTSPTFVAALHGVLAAGAVAAPCNPLAPPAEVARELLAVDAAAVVVGAAGVPAVSGIDPGALSRLAAVVAGPGVDLPGVDIPGAVPYADVDPETSAWCERLDDDVAVLLFTSGTAGSPRPAMLTHRNLAVNRRQVLAHLGELVRPGDVALCALPLFHVFALNSVLGVVLDLGGAAVLQPRFDPMAALAAVVEHEVAVLVGAPPMWAAFAALPDDSLEPLRRLRVAASGAAALPRPVAERLRAAGVVVAEGYGLTEASPSVCMATGTDAPIGSVGPPLPAVELRLVTPDGEDVLVGDEGEIWVRGPNVFAGYWRDEEATRAVLSEDGWLRTGDLAVVDDRGNLSIVDRIKDLIIVSGFNVSPREVEEVLLAHPAVAAAVVHGVPHPHTGEAVHAAVVAAAGAAVEVDALLRHCEGELARYKCPASVRVVDALPVGRTGKTLRPR